MRWAVFTDADADMRADEFNIRATDGRHTNEIIGATQETGEGCRKGDLAAGGQTGGGTDHVLFRDEILKEPPWVLFAEFIGIG